MTLKTSRTEIAGKFKKNALGVPAKVHDDESWIKSLTNLVLDQNQVHWLYDGKCWK